MTLSESKSLKVELARLATGLYREQLQDLWRRLYGSDPPEQISRQLLTQAVAHRLQVVLELKVLAPPSSSARSSSPARPHRRRIAARANTASCNSEETELSC
jgi:hypothetical protein